MNFISLSERAREADGSFEVVVRFEDGGEHVAKVADPLASDPTGERLLTWYFEEHLRYPFLDQDQQRAAVALLERYGTELFDQVFGGDGDCAYEFRRVRNAGFDGLRLEVVGSTDFHRLHWESLRDDGPGTPLGARIPITRRVENVAVGFDIAAQGPTLNVLVMTARPNGARDVGYRTISRPLLAALRQARIPVSVDLVRPGSWRALESHLQAVTSEKGSGWYGIVHFDVHGAVTNVDGSSGGSDYLLGESGPAVDDQDAYLFFETSEIGVADPVPTSKVANLLVEHRVPVAVLNACQSAMQSGESEASLAQRLVEAGVPVSVGMAYSVTVSAAELMMPVIYKQIAEGMEILQAVHAGRRELFDVRGRRAYFDQELDLEDWVLPVVFSQRPVELQPQAQTPDEEQNYYTIQVGQVDEPAPEYGFVGRDLDVQAIERHLLGEGAQNELLVWGMAGAGKSTLLGHLAWWWQATGLVKRVFSFSYENRAWTLDQILQAVIAELLDGHEQVLAQALPADAQLERVATLLRAERHLLVLDNAESITAAPASIPHSLPEAERARLGRFLSRLRGGKTLVLIGSRGPEKWLAADAFGPNVYELGGLDPQASSILLERIITRHGGSLPDTAAEREALEELVTVLGGYPLALTVVLPAIASTPPSDVLAELKRGGEGTDPAKIIQRAVEFSHGRLDPTTQSSLIVLAPFTGVVPKFTLDLYGELLGKHEAVKALGALDLEAGLSQAIDVGLATAEARFPGHIRLQPLFPFFLRTRLADQPDLAAAAAQAHHDLYQQFGPSLHALLLSRKPDERTTGRALMRIEYANLTSALDHALSFGKPLPPLVEPLEEYLDQTHQEHARQRLLERVIAAIGDPCPKERRSELSGMHNLAGVAALARHRLADARAHHEAELALDEELGDRRSAASAYHQLGRVAQEERHVEEAEAHYKKALEIKFEFDDRHSAAVTYHQLGRITEMQRRFDEAEGHYKEALKIFNEFSDRYETADIYHQLGILADERQDFKESEASYRKAIEIFREFDDRHGAASSYHQLGRAAQEQGRIGEAEAHYKKALEIKLEFNDRHSAANSYHQLGRVAEEQGRFEEAEAHYRKAIEIKVEFKERSSAAASYHQLGRVAEEQGRFDDARERFEEALEMFNEHDDRHSAGVTLHRLGRVAEEQGNVEDAEAHYKEAVEIFHEFGDRRREANSQSQLGALLTRPDRIHDGIRYSLTALLAWFEIITQWSEPDLRCLKAQRELIGPDGFRAEVVGFADEELFTRLTALLDGLDDSQEGIGAP